MTTKDEKAAMIRGKTIPFMAVSLLFLALALLAGVFRLMGQNGVGPLLLAPLYGLHPLLMVFGFIGGVIMTERVAGTELLPASRGSRLSASMVPFVFAGVTVEALGYGAGLVPLRYGGALLLATGGGLFLAQVVSFYRADRENLSVAFMALSGASLLVSSILSGLELPAGNTGFIMLLLLFPISFILGERVELTSLVSGRQPRRLRPALLLLSVCLLLFAVASAPGLLPSLGYVDLVAFFLLAATLAFFLRQEPAAPSLSPATGAAPLQQYVKLHVGAAYLWGLAGSFFGVVYVIGQTFQFYDAFVHSLALGFIGTMLLAHGPIILPAVLGRTFDHGKLSRTPLLLLTLGLLLRIAGNVSMLALQQQSEVLRVLVSLSGWVVIAAVLAFFAELARATRGVAKAPSAAAF